MANYFGKKYSQIIDYFITQADKNDSALYRASRIRISIILVTAVLWTIFIFSSIKFEFIFWQPLVNVIAVILSLIAVFLSKKGKSISTVVNVHMIGGCIGIFGSCITQGGLVSISAILLIPVVAMIIGGARISLFWFIVSFAFLTTIYALINLGYKFDYQFNAEYTNYILYSNAIGMLVASFLCLQVFQTEKNLAYRELDMEKDRSESLLLNILPIEVADELKKTGDSKAKHYDFVSILFTDFVNFTGISEQLGPTELVAELNKQFTLFDSIIEKYGLEKIKTIGDAYMAVCGLPIEDPKHAENTILAAKEIIKSLSANNSIFKVRIGINSGDVVAGIIGVKKYAYDIWGDAVNTAARMEQNSEANKINVSSSTYDLVKDKFKFEYRGKIVAKNKGEIDMYYVVD